MPGLVGGTIAFTAVFFIVTIILRWAYSTGQGAQAGMLGSDLESGTGAGSSTDAVANPGAGTSYSILHEAQLHFQLSLGLLRCGSHGFHSTCRSCNQWGVGWGCKWFTSCNDRPFNGPAGALKLVVKEKAGLVESSMLSEAIMAAMVLPWDL